MSPEPMSTPGRRSRESSRRKRIRARPARPTTTKRAIGASERVWVSDERDHAYLPPCAAFNSACSDEIEISHSGRLGPDPAVHRLSVVRFTAQRRFAHDRLKRNLLDARE